MKIQGAIAQEVLIIWIAFVVLPTLLIILLPYIDRILTDETIQLINNIIWNIEQFIGSTNTNLLFIWIWLCLIIPVIRRFITFINGNQNS